MVVIANNNSQRVDRTDTWEMSGHENPTPQVIPYSFMNQRAAPALTGAIRMDLFLDTSNRDRTESLILAQDERWRRA